MVLAVAISVALAEDSLIVREGLQQLLATEPDISWWPPAAISTRFWRRRKLTRQTWFDRHPDAPESD